MVRTCKDKIIVSTKFINSIDNRMTCKSFSGHVLKCDCLHAIQKLGVFKDFFTSLVDEFWQNPFLKDNSTDSQVTGLHLSEYLDQYRMASTMRKDRYQFEISEDDEVILCLPTVTKIFGLGDDAHTEARKRHNNHKIVGLDMLKVVSFKGKGHGINWDANFRGHFPHQVVPCSVRNPSAVHLVENQLKGKLLELDAKACAAIKYLHKHHYTTWDNLTQVTKGGENIFFGPPSNVSSKWNCLNKPKTKPLLDSFVQGLTDLWGAQYANKVKYQVSFLFSKLTPTRDNTPQLAHTDFTDSCIKQTFKKINVKPCVGFTSINPDGMMLLVWTKEKAKYKKKEDRNDASKKKRGQYYLYIPFGTFLIIPGNVYHAGGFCFGSKLNGPGIPNTHKDFTNHRLHFFFCPSMLSVADVNLGDNEVIKEDNPENHDLFPDPVIMDKLNKCLLTSHDDIKE